MSCVVGTTVGGLCAQRNRLGMMFVQGWEGVDKDLAFYSKWDGREEERALSCPQVPSGCVWGTGCGGRGGSWETRGRDGSQSRGHGD